MLLLCLKRKIFLWLILTTSILSTGLLSGCLGTHPVKTNQLYVLNPVEETKSLVKGMEGLPLLSVEITSLRLPQYLEKPQIITRSHQNQLIMAEYHQWGGNLRKNMIRVMAQNISRLLDTPKVSMAPFRPSPAPDFCVDVEVMGFEADGLGQVKFSAQWRLGGNGKTLTTRMTTLETPVQGGSLDFDPIVLAMGSLVGDFCQIIAQEILEQATGTLGK